MNKENFVVKKLFYYFVSLHVLIWTLAPSLIRFTLPVDAMEGTTWGRQLQWGYDKDPFLNAWLTELAVKMGGHSGWCVYLFSQLVVALCFFAVWRLACKILSPAYALLSVILLEAIQYYNVAAIDFNDNVLEIGLWALAILFFYKAIKHQKVFDWIGLGILAGLAMMAKYYSGVLLATMFLWMLLNKSARRSFSNKNCYIGMAFFIIIIAPHLYWLSQHEFITIKYMFRRAGAITHHVSHFYYATQFLLDQLQAFILPLVLFCMVFIKAKNKTDLTVNNIILSDKHFVLFFATIPLIITLFFSVLTKARLHLMWGSPLLSLWPLLLIMFVKPRLNLTKLWRIYIIIVFLMVVAATCYSYSQFNAGDTSSANYPGQVISKRLTQQWQQRYPHHPWLYVAGSRYEAGAASFYAASRPAVFINWDQQASSWINLANFNKAGAIFIWTPDEFSLSYVDANIKPRFPTMTQPQLEKFDWMRDKTVPPLALWVAFLPPKN